MKEIRRRAVGTEFEWAVGFRVEAGDKYVFNQTDLLSDIINNINEERGLRRGGQMLLNGGKCYLDSSNLEYCTGEEDTLDGVVAAEIAGERIVTNAVREHVENSERVVGYQVLKRSFITTNSAENGSNGYHINLCAESTNFTYNEDGMYDLGLWAATTGIFTGAGCLYKDTQGNVNYAISQKAIASKAAFSNSSITDKPLVCLRNEPHADSSKFYRVQITGLDPNISPWAMRMNIGMASLCLRVMEQNRDRDQIRLKKLPIPKYGRNDPLAILANQVATNPDRQVLATLSDGSTITPLEIQERAYELAATTEHTDEEAAILVEWKKALDSARSDEVYLEQKSGWRIKRAKLEQFAQRRDVPLGDSEVLARDRKWDALYTGSAADLLRTGRWSADMPPEDLIRHREDDPCPDTRAIVRSKAMKLAKHFTTSSFSWEHYQLGKEHTVRIPDPLMTKVPPQTPNQKVYYDDEGDETFVQPPPGYYY